MRFLDVHTHAQFAAYDLDRTEVINRALSMGVGVINVGTEKRTSKKAVDFAHGFEDAWATVGIHPTHASGSSHHDENEVEEAVGPEGEKFDYEYYKKLAADPKVVAIGECGLDYFRLEGGEEAKKKQKEVFLRQIELAREVRKPLMIHCRSAFLDLIEILNTKYKILNTPPGIIHFFSGTKDDAEKLLDMGFYFTFGGVITFVRDYDKVIEMIPVERILSETDAPYVAPAPYRGKRNEPAYVVEVVKKLAELKKLSMGAMAAQILKNAENCFNLKLL